MTSRSRNCCNRCINGAARPTHPPDHISTLLTSRNNAHETGRGRATARFACGNDRQFRSLAGVLGQEGLAGDERYATNTARVASREELVPLLNDLLQAADAQDWAQRLSAVGVPAGPVNDLAEAFEYAEQQGLSPIVDCAGGRQAANPIRMSATPVTYRSAPPPLGNQPLGDEPLGE